MAADRITTIDLTEVLKTDEMLASEAFKEVLNVGINGLKAAIISEHKRTQEECSDIHEEASPIKKPPLEVGYLEALKAYAIGDRDNPLVREREEKTRRGEKLIFIQAGSKTHTNKQHIKTVPLFNDDWSPRDDVRQLAIHTDKKTESVTVALELVKMVKDKNDEWNRFTDSVIAIELTSQGPVTVEEVVDGTKVSTNKERFLIYYTDRFRGPNINNSSRLSNYTEPSGMKMHSAIYATFDVKPETATAFKSLMFKKKNK